MDTQTSLDVKFGEIAGTQEAPEAPGTSCWFEVEGDSEHRFALEKASIRVGRSRNCDLRIDDHAVSRVHLIVEQKGAGWIARDAGSENGMWVQGKRRTSHRLRDGDRLELGESALIFRETRAGALSHRVSGQRRDEDGRGRGRALVALALGEGRGKRSRLILGAGLVLASICAPLAFSLSAAASEPAVEESGPDALVLFDEGLVWIEAGAWGKAKEAFKAALATEPSAEELRRYVAQMEREEEASTRLAAAHRCRGDGNRRCVEEALREIDPHGLAYLAEGGDILRSWLDEAFEPALAIDEEPAEFPEERALPLAAAEGGPVVADTRPMPVRRAPSKRPNQRQVAAQALAAGEVDSAIATLRAAGEEALARRVVQVAGVIEDGGATGSLEQLEATLSVLRDLGIRGELPLRLGKRIAEESVRSGVVARQRGNLKEAYRLFVRAREVDPTSRLAAQQLEEIRTRAHALLIEGYGLRKRMPESAREKLLAVLDLSAPSDEVHQKALKWLATLDEAS